MLGERLGEEDARFVTGCCFKPSVLFDLGGGVATVRVLREAAGEMVGVVDGEVWAGFVSLREGLWGGVGVSCWEEKPESRETRF